MKIALLGTRGIPASYSGFETCVEQLGKRLVERGHEVTVYCRTPPHHLSRRRLSRHAARQAAHDRQQVSGHARPLLLLVAARPAGTLRHRPLLHRRQQPSHLDSTAERSQDPAQRRRAGLEAREVAHRSQRSTSSSPNTCATILPNVYLTDSTVVQRYYQDRYGSTPPYIPYGSDVEITAAG